MSDELGISPAPADEEKIEDIYVELDKIAGALVSYTKKNSDRTRMAVITNSAKPVVLCYVSSEGKLVNLHVPVPHISSEKLKDSNAAGDSFVGGFLAKLCMIMENGKINNFDDADLTTAVKAGNEMAGKVV
jgi:sugar/nucleoside kinase (ribokinase family)